MPYFTRQPYSVVDREGVPPAGGAGEDTDILDLAKSVLAESGGAPGVAFRARRPARAGENAQLRLRFAADGGGPPLSLRCAADEMTGSAGSVAAACIAVEPAEFTVRADKAAILNVTVAIPEDTGPGLYTGRLRVTGDERFDEIIEVDVTAATAQARDS